MSTRTQSKVKTPSAPTPSFMPVQTGFLHGKSVFGHTPSLADECAASRGKSLVSQPPLIQAKLTIDQPGDKDEQEADRVADRLMLIPGRCLQRQKEADEEETVQAEKDTGRSHEVPSDHNSRTHDMIGRGQSLPFSVRNFFEPLFGYDFSHVRVHMDTRAEKSARAVNAKAYTVGKDIVFGTNQYSPSSNEGKRLLAHELTHVVQQRHASGYSPSALEAGSNHDSLEQEAHTIAEHVISERPAGQVRHKLREQRLQRSSFKETLKKIPVIGSLVEPISRLFGGGTFSDTELQEYLNYLDKNKKIEDDYDSDNKAREIVRRGLHKGKDLKIRILLIREMLSGYFSDADKQGILSILKDANVDELENIAKDSSFKSGELDTLYSIYPAFHSLNPRGGKETKTYTVEEYIKKWEKEHGRKMTASERATLARGCIGITALNLGSNGLPNPALSHCYATFKEAWDAKRKMNEFLQVHFPDRKALLFSKRFWSSGQTFVRDPVTGRIDMSGYTYAPRPGFVNFDYGLYDEKTGKWWHANHNEPGMKIYESNLKHYSRPLIDFDKQVFCVGISNLR